MSKTYQTRLADFIRQCKGAGTTLQDRQLEWQFERLRHWGNGGDPLSWLESQRATTDMRVQQIALRECRGWYVDEDSGNVLSSTGQFFVVEGVRVTTSSRERPSGWDQPIITQVGFDGGIIGLLSQRFDGVPLYLVEAKAEPGNPGLVQLSPTVQATFSNLNQAHGGRSPLLAEFFTGDEPAGVLVRHWMSEDGGRLFNKRNLGLVVEVPPTHLIDVPEGFTWMSLFQIQTLVRQDAQAGPHIRSLVAMM